MKRMTQLLGLILLPVLAAAGCSEDDGGLTAPPDGEAPFQVVLQPSTGPAPAPATASLPFDPPPPNAARIPLEQVEAITLAIGEVEARRDDGGWIQAGSLDETVNLLDLPAEGITLVDGSLPEGAYDKLRLFMTAEPTITLTQDVVVGRTTFEAGEHPLSIPSADKNGLRLQAAFAVDAEGEELAILFDEAATVDRVTATGSGVLKIAPELRIRDDDGDDVGGLDDAQDDDQGEDEIAGLVTAAGEDSFTVDVDGTPVVVQVSADTELEGDILSLEALAEALEDGETVEAEVEGTLSADGTTMEADEVELEVVEEENEAEAEGPVTAVDAGAGTFTVDDEGTSVVVQVDDDTAFDPEGDYLTFDEMVAAFEAGTAIEAEAEGELDDDGVLLADEVKAESDD